MSYGDDIESILREHPDEISLAQEIFDLRQSISSCLWRLRDVKDMLSSGYLDEFSTPVLNIQTLIKILESK